MKIKDLWQALLKEKFVFSFKNTLEITAYNSLETAYSMWDWTFTEAMLKWEQKAENAISAASPEKVPALVRGKHKELHFYVLEQIKPLKSKMKQFFNGKQSDILVQWKAKFEQRLVNLSSKLKSHAEHHCTQLGHNKEVITKFQDKQDIYADMITKKVLKFIASIKKEQENLYQSLQEEKLKPEQLNVKNEDCDRVPDDQMKKILQKRRETEEELEQIFDYIWIDFIKELPYVPRDSRDVETEVEEKMIEVVRAQGHEGEFIATLQKKKSLRAWGENIHKFIPEMKKHYTHNSWYQHFFSNGDNYQKDVIKVTEQVFSTAIKYLKETTQNDTDFNTAFVQELLQKVQATIVRESAYLKDYLTLTWAYRKEIYLIVCGFAVPRFEKMAESFRKRNDPRFYLEKKLKFPLFIKFKNQYNQIEAEEAIASTFCSYLEEPIKVQVGNTLGAEMVDIMRKSPHHFSSKMALKTKVLTDLHDEDNFEGYMAYVSNIRDCLEDHIKKYTVEFCDEIAFNGHTRLQNSAKKEVSRLIGVVQAKVDDLNESDAHKWLSAFSSDIKIREELGVALKAEELLEGYDDLQELNLENIKKNICGGLNDLKMKLEASFDTIKYKSEMVNWKNKPHELLRKLIGCTEQCPFCKEQCDQLIPDHIRDNQKHKIAVHRPECLGGYHWIKTNVLVTDFCPALVASDATFKDAATNQEHHPFKDFQSIYPNWSIPPDITSEESLYWKWFICKYKEELGIKYNAKPPEVPPQWHDIKWEEVKENLERTYKLNRHFK